jgi:hypothetical protein
MSTNDEEECGRQEAAQYIPCSVQWLDYERRTGRGPAYYRNVATGRITYLKRDLDAYRAQRSVKVRHEPNPVPPAHQRRQRRQQQEESV